MINEIKGNEELNVAGWDNTVIFVDETKSASEYFECCILLTVKTY